MRGEKLGCGTAVPEGQRLHHLTPPAPLPRRLPQPSTTNACTVCSGLGDKAGWQGAMARRDAGDKATPDPSRDVEEQLRDLIAAPSCSSPHRAGADRVRPSHAAAASSGGEASKTFVAPALAAPAS